jgi:hypoxanthine phosphoribosyltransferase
MAVTSYGASTKSSGVVRILKDLDTGIEDLNVIIVEDIIDSGITLNYLHNYLLGRQPKTLKICTLLDKPERREVDHVKPDYVGFEVGNKFIVGYGLDYNQKYRNLPYISCLEEV